MHTNILTVQGLSFVMIDLSGAINDEIHTDCGKFFFTTDKGDEFEYAHDGSSRGWVAKIFTNKSGTLKVTQKDLNTPPVVTCECLAIKYVKNSSIRSFYTMDEDKFTELSPCQTNLYNVISNLPNEDFRPLRESMGNYYLMAFAVLTSEKSLSALTEEDAADIWAAIGGHAHTFDLAVIKIWLIDGEAPEGIMLDALTMYVLTEKIKSLGYNFIDQDEPGTAGGETSLTDVL